MGRCSRVAFLCLLIGLASAIVLPGLARAVDTPVEDEIFGTLTEEAVWSEGLWTNPDNPGEECITFPGGQTTGPGGDHFLDQIVCSFAPTSWSWNVIIPGPHTVYWSVDNIPCDVMVCGQIFYMAGIGQLQSAADLEADWITIRDMNGNLLYEGTYSTFVPGEHGFQTTELRRCGVVACPTPVERSSWGQIKHLYE